MILLSSKRGEAFPTVLIKGISLENERFGLNTEGEATQNYPEPACARQETKVFQMSLGTKADRGAWKGFLKAWSQDRGAGKVMTQRISGQR